MEINSQELLSFIELLSSSKFMKRIMFKQPEHATFWLTAMVLTARLAGTPN